MNRSRIILFEGEALVSKAISKLTGSNQTHVGWQTPDGCFYEAVDDGVVKNDPKDGDVFLKWHKKGTLIHFFEYEVPLTEQQEELVKKFLETAVNQPYGYRTLFTFMLHPTSDPNPEGTICSELVEGASIACGLPLAENIRPWNCAPVDIYRSARLKWIGSARIGIDPYF